MQYVQRKSFGHHWAVGFWDFGQDGKKRGGSLLLLCVIEIICRILSWFFHIRRVIVPYSKVATGWSLAAIPICRIIVRVCRRTHFTIFDISFGPACCNPDTLSFWIFCFPGWLRFERIDNGTTTSGQHPIAVPDHQVVVQTAFMFGNVPIDVPHLSATYFFASLSRERGKECAPWPAAKWTRGSIFISEICKIPW